MDEVYTHCIPLPNSIKGVTVPDGDGNYTILVNANLCPAARRHALEHELHHIRSSHFCDIVDICIAEQKRHKKTALLR